MSKNLLYANEIATAHQFVIEHNTDIKLQNFLYDMRFRKDLMHSDRWSLCYDFLKENYPAATDSIVTGLVYYLED